MRDIEKERQRHRQRESWTFFWILGSLPELKADTQPLNHPGVPCDTFV